MSVVFRLPDLGEGMAEAEIVHWLVQPGERVRRDQPLAEVQTDKALVELPSPAAGRIAELAAQEGEVVPVGATLVTIEAEDEEDKQEAVQDTESDAENTHSALFQAPPADALRVSTEGQAIPANQVLATPAVRHLARELGVDLTTVPPSGPHGRITEEDVRQAAAKTAVSSPQRAPELASSSAEERIPLRGLRREIAAHVTQAAFTAPHVTLFGEAEVTHLVALRDRLYPRLQEEGIGLTYLPFVVKAVVAGLHAFPMLNASLDDAGQEIVLHPFYHIGIATATPEGLLVPVLRDADRKSLHELAKEIQELAQRARERRCTPEELRGSTFTVTNYGAFGGSFGTPILNFPNSAILGIGRIDEKPWVRDHQLVVAPVLPFSLSFDHRLIDGETAQRFLNRLFALLSDPDQLLLEMN
ncbi:MAG: 2-oxo acid dehydrogenase subunit E2 [Firmicutes bacterium]|nr:2-oxo acid dehydrogenase subunit E2 [Bacillota bacterium]